MTDYTNKDKKTTVKGFIYFNSDLSITGEIEDEIGNAYLSGKLIENFKIDLEKQYVGAHKVTYIGEIVKGIIELSLGF